MNNQAQYLKAMGIDIWQSREEETETTALAEAPIQDFTQVPADELDWESLQSTVASCTKCDLSQSRKNTVFGVGNPQADLMIIGEAPGASEDAQGEPFVGRAGQLLNEMLKAIGLERQDIFIANILKCRPPNNRDPEISEKQSCTPYLIRQIELIKPKLIVALGRVSGQFLLDCDTALGKLRTQTHEYQNTPLIVTYHPAYLLRSPGEKKKSWIDLCRIKGFL